VPPHSAQTTNSAQQRQQIAFKSFQFRNGFRNVGYGRFVYLRTGIHLCFCVAWLRHHKMLNLKIQFFCPPPQEQHAAPIQVKFGVENNTTGLLSVLNFTIISEWKHKKI